MSDTTPQSVSNGCRKYVKSRIDFNNFNTFINVNKIRKYLIHLLGGVTEEECGRKAMYHALASRACILQTLVWEMQRHYGMSADEWCKAVYEYTCDRHKHAEKEYNDYVKETSIFKLIAKKKS